MPGGAALAGAAAGETAGGAALAAGAGGETAGEAVRPVGAAAGEAPSVGAALAAGETEGEALPALSVADARSAFGELAAGAAAEGRVAVAGQVCHQRKLSKRLLFVDLRQLGAQRAVYAGQPKLEVVVKAQQLGDEEMARLRREIKLGDEVRVEGRMERCARQDDLVLVADLLTFTAKWAEAQPGTSFTPDPIGKGAGQANGKRARAEPEPPPPAFLTPGAAGGVEPTAGVGLCKFFTNQGTCAREACPFLHVQRDALAATRSVWVTERKRSRLEAARLPGDPHENESKKDKAARAALFADFLLSEYGEDHLRSGAGVVDVAGGKGELSFELSCRRRVETSLVEPRPQKMTKQQRKFFKQRKKKDKKQAAAGGAAGAGDTLAMPRQFRCLFGPHLLQEGKEESAGGDASPDVPALSAAELEALKKVLKDCSAVVGMHPDQVRRPRNHSLSTFSRLTVTVIVD